MIPILMVLERGVICSLLVCKDRGDLEELFIQENRDRGRETNADELSNGYVNLERNVSIRMLWAGDSERYRGSEKVSDDERMAVALESIADSLQRLPSLKTTEETKPETLFPWGEAPPSLQRWKPKGYAPLPKSDERPSTCEGLLRLGRSCLMQLELEYVGRKCVAKLDPIMERLGFGEQWLKS